MRKILIILGLVVLLIGISFVGAVSFGIVEVDFTDKVLVIDTKAICDVEALSLSSTKLCDKTTPDEIEIGDKLSILQDSKTGVIKITNPNNEILEISPIK